MKILIACEESQMVCIEMRKLGHEAYSCDIQEPSGGHPEWHIKCDALKLINPTKHWGDFCIIWTGVSFFTMDGEYHWFYGRWDLIIAHPPCTYLSNAGACRLYPKKGELNQERYTLGLEAKDFFMKFIKADCDKICVENPIPSKVFDLPPYSQVIQPFEYGHAYSKKTCLWLKGLPLLKPTKIITGYKPYVSCGTSKNKGIKDKQGVSRAGGSAKMRSKTFPGIAKAMAEQWAGKVEKNTAQSSKTL